MTLAELLESLTPDERDFIANLDQGDDHDEHRRELDAVIENQGTIDADLQLWYPYAVVEMGKNMLHPGHAREFAACVGLVLHNVLQGTDKMNNVAQITTMLAPQISTLPDDLRELITGFVQVRDDMLTTRRIQLRAPKPEQS